MPGVNFESDNDDFDSQDQAEAFDETNFGQGGDVGEVRTFQEADDNAVFEDLPEVKDLTQLIGDRDDDEAVEMDADSFDPDAVTDADLEEDDELAYRAATAEREDDIDGQRAEDGFDEGRIARSEIDGLDETRDAAEAQGREDDTTDYQAKSLSDEDLKMMGYMERHT